MWMKNLDTFILPLISCALNVRASIFISKFHQKGARNKRNKITIYGTFYQTKTTLMSLARRPHEIVLGSYTLNDSCGSSHVRTDAQTKMKSDLCMLLHHTLHWAVYETS